MCQNTYDDRSTLVQVMAWCCQAPRHYLSQGDRDLCYHMVSLGRNELKWFMGQYDHSQVSMMVADVLLPIWSYDHLISTMEYPITKWVWWLLMTWHLFGLMTISFLQSYCRVRITVVVLLPRWSHDHLIFTIGYHIAKSVWWLLMSWHLLSLMTILSPQWNIL